MSLVANDLLATLPDTVADEIKLWLPDLRDCRGMAGRFDLAQLKAKGIRAPAVLVARLGARQGKTMSGAVPVFHLDMAAFVITKDGMGLDRDSAAANICQMLLRLIPDQNWARPGLGEAQDVKEQVLVSAATDKQATNLSAVSWMQPVMLTSIEAAQPLAIDLYVGQAPDIGADHQGDYDQIGGDA